MSEKVTLKSLYQALQKDMLAKAEFGISLNHPVDKGDNAEANWIKWFNDYLPDRYKAAKATVIDCQGNVSDQIDIVLYDRQYSYLAFNQNEILYIPSESVYAVFEVKQELNKENMEYAGEKAESVRKLHRTSAPIPYAAGIYKPKPLHRIIAGVLTTNSDWKYAFGNSFKKCLAKYADYQQIDCGCVLNNGAFHYDYHEAKLRISSEEESLVYFYLQLLILLQSLGTVPAIDLAEYMKALDVREEICQDG